jgi:formate dehydrogenase subunit delta
MSPETLVRMANQIATFFKTQDIERAPAATADHLVKFWEPRMRAEIIALHAAGVTGLDPIAAEAVDLLPRPVEKSVASTPQS